MDKFIDTMIVYSNKTLSTIHIIDTNMHGYYEESIL